MVCIIYCTTYNENNDFHLSLYKDFVSVLNTRNWQDLEKAYLRVQNKLINKFVIFSKSHYSLKLKHTTLTFLSASVHHNALNGMDKQFFNNLLFIASSHMLCVKFIYNKDHEIREKAFVCIIRVCWSKI